MSDLILFGTRRWTAVPGVIGFEDQYDAAVEVVRSYIFDAIKMMNTVPNPNPDLYFASAPFSLLGDLNGAVDLIRKTPQIFHRSSLNGIIQQMPTEWRTGEGITLWFDLIWNETINEQLSRVWRAPEFFPRSPAFDQELGNRAMAYSLPATVWSGALTDVVIEQALNQLSIDHENSKRQWEFAIELLKVDRVEREEFLDRREIKRLKRDFDLDEFTDEWLALYAAHSKELNRRITHIIKYSDFVGWKVAHPNLSARRR